MEKDRIRLSSPGNDALHNSEPLMCSIYGILKVTGRYRPATGNEQILSSAANAGVLQ